MWLRRGRPGSCSGCCWNADRRLRHVPDCSVATVDVGLLLPSAAGLRRVRDTRQNVNEPPSACCWTRAGDAARSGRPAGDFSGCCRRHRPAPGPGTWPFTGRDRRSPVSVGLLPDADVEARVLGLRVDGSHGDERGTSFVGDQTDLASRNEREGCVALSLGLREKGALCGIRIQWAAVPQSRSPSSTTGPHPE